MKISKGLEKFDGTKNHRALGDHDRLIDSEFNEKRLSSSFYKLGTEGSELIGINF